MAYIDAEYYRNDYKGVPVDDDFELEALIIRASLLVDEITGHKLALSGGLDMWLADNPGRAVCVKAVKDAVACQTEYMFLSGGIEGAALALDDDTRVSIGGFSYGGDYGRGGKARDRRVSRAVPGLLAVTGLLYRGESLC